jgi:hypothetical protein
VYNQNHAVNYFALKYLQDLQAWLPPNLPMVQASFKKQARLDLQRLV